MPLFILTETSAGYVRLSQLRGSIASARSSLLAVASSKKPQLTDPHSYGLFKAADKKLLDDDNLNDRLSTVDKIVKE